MKDIKNILEELRANVADNATSASQGLKLEDVKVQQLHPSQEQLKQLENTDIQDFFFLVTQVDENTCKVIAGSMDGIMAGPNDIVLPKNVLGQYVYLSLDMQATIPKNALSAGFAILDKDSYNRIIASCQEFAGDPAGKIPAYSRAMPYISDHDDRIEYHKKQRELLVDIQKNYGKPRLHTFLRMFEIKHFSKVAAGLLVGILLLFIYLSGNPYKSVKSMPYPTEKQAIPPQAPIASEAINTEKVTPSGKIRGNADDFVFYSFDPAWNQAPRSPITQGHENTEKIVPSGKMRGNENTIAIYSPQQAIWSEKPQISIGGDKEKTYLVTILADGKEIAKKEVSGNSVTPWDVFSDCQLTAESVYKLTIKSNGKTVAQKDFWVLNQDEKNKLQAALIRSELALKKSLDSGEIKKSANSYGFVGKSANSYGAWTYSRNKLPPQEIIFRRAEIFYDNKCYSEAYLLITKLLKIDKDNEKYQYLKNKCLKKLSIKNTEE